MEIKKLIIHNITSIEDATIDFTAEPLADSDVFLICGKTGAGKSTILDAICLALYGTTPRLEALEEKNARVSDGDRDLTVRDPRQLLRRDTGEGYVTLLFAAAGDTLYEATWSVQRARRSPQGALQSKTWLLRDLTHGTSWDRDKDIAAEVLRATSLPFEQFRRTTMLAQGDFMSFLNSRDEEKAAILERITGTAIYSEIGRQVFRLAQQCEMEYQSTQRAAGAITLLDDESLRQRQARQAEIAEALTAADNEKRTLDGKVEWLRTEANLQSQLQQAVAEADRTRAAVDNDTFRQRQQTVSDWTATIDARQHLQALRQADEAVVQARTALQRHAGRYQAAMGGLAFAREGLQKAATQLKQSDERLAKAAQCCAEQQQLVEARQKLLAEAALEEWRRRQTEATERLHLLDRSALVMKGWHDEQQRQTREREALQTMAADQQKLEQQLATLDKELAAARTTRDERQRSLETMRNSVGDWAKVARASLRPGDLCPVCRQRVEQPLHIEEELQQLLATAEADYNKAEQQFRTAEGSCNRTAAQLATLKADLLRRSEALKDTSVQQRYQADAATLLQATGIDVLQADSESRLDESRRQWQATLADIMRHIEAGEALQKEVEAQRQRLMTLLNGKERVTADHAALQQQMATLQGEITSAEEPLRQIADTLPEWRSLPPAAPAALPRLAAEATALLAEANACQSRILAATDESTRHNSWLDSYLASHPDNSRERLTHLATIRQDTVEAERTALAAATAAVGEKASIVQALQSRSHEHQATRPPLAEGDTLPLLTAVLQTLAAQRDTLAAERGRIEQELTTDADNRSRQADLLQEVERRRSLSERWKALSRTFGDTQGKAFRTIAQSYVLANLIHSANHYMHQLSDRYELQVEPGSFAITVTDAYQGYLARATSTISGGESFLVSLALALALSDIGHQLSANILFIDEGFGTLSGEPLQNAVATLRALHTQSGRHVGIISHIDELRERIPVQIQVQQQGHNGRSTVTVVP